MGSGRGKYDRHLPATEYIVTLFGVNLVGNIHYLVKFCIFERFVETKCIAIGVMPNEKFRLGFELWN